MSIHRTRAIAPHTSILIPGLHFLRKHNTGHYSGTGWPVITSPITIAQERSISESS